MAAAMYAEVDYDYIEDGGYVTNWRECAQAALSAIHELGLVIVPKDSGL